MQYAKLLPIPKGSTQSQWIEGWLQEIAGDVQSQTREISALRERNERFASYLPTLTTIIAIYREQITAVKQSIPREEKESKTAYNERVDEQTSGLRHMRDFIEKWHSDISTRLSGAQTDIRTQNEEAKHAV